MTATLRQDVDFNGLFKKLGHHLEEIRVRALENILSKLDHKLICDSDLVQERHLLIRLLEWFNFPRSPRHSDVLNLLLRLSQHTPATEILQDVGGVEFLANVRKDVVPALQPIVDQILENTMTLPDMQGGMDHAPECIYQKHNASAGGAGGAAGHAGVETTMDTVLSRQTHEHTGLSITRTTAVEPTRLPDYREPPLGFFEGEGSATPARDIASMPQEPQTGHDTDSACFRMTIFPWLALTPTDRHVIASTNTSLQSRDPAVLVSTCEFLSDVVFQDFPAEIFLQRPNVIKNLLSLLSGADSGQLRPRLQALRTLTEFAASLRSKVRSHQDPNIFTPKQDFSSTPSPFSTPSSASSVNNNVDGRPSAIGWTEQRPRGDGRDGDTSASSTASSHASSVGLSPGPEQEQMDLEEIPSLQYIQMTIPQFCASVLDKALPLMKTNDEVVVTEVFQLLYRTLDIIVAIVTPALWEDSTMAARECVDKFTETLDVVADLLKFHHHSNIPFDIEESSLQAQGCSDLVQHRLAYMGLAEFVTRFLKCLVPADKCQGVIPETLLAAINTLVYDECLSDSNPDLQIMLLGYLRQLDTGRYDVYVLTATICQSLQKTCKFMTLSQEEVSRLSKDTLSQCEAAFASLPYHKHMAYIAETIKLCALVCTKSQHYETQQTQYRKLVMKFMCHPLNAVRQHAYRNVLNIVQTALSVSEASDPGSTSCERVKFIINTDILYEIIVFGLADTDAKVSSLAADLMTHLLKSQLLMTPDLWQMFLQCLLRGLPVLQSYAGLTSVLGTSILSMLEPQTVASQNDLPNLEKLRGALRCMLSADIKVRSESLRRLLWHLNKEENSTRKLPISSDLVVTNLTNLLIVDTPRSVDDDVSRMVFQVDGLRKVYEIFTSLSVDPAVKKSAVDQLAIILQDPTLHPAFKKDGGFEKVLEHLQLGVLKDGESSTNAYIQYLPACTTILRSLVHHDYSLRHKLAHDPHIYHTLLRVALLHMRDERTCYEVSHALTLLLFDEQARFFMGESKDTAFTVPSIVKTRYRLPFRTPTFYETSPYACAPPPDPDPLMTGLPLEMMRVAWNVAWYGGMPSLVKGVTGSKSQKNDGDFSARLKVTPTDAVLLATSHINEALQTSVYDIANATSHHNVSRALTRLLSHVVSRCNVIKTFHSLDWCNALDRFVKVIPSSSADETLLLDILRFVTVVLRLTNQVPDNILQWVGEVLYHPKGPLIGLLHRQSIRDVPDDVAEDLVNIKRSLDKTLLTFIATYNSSLPYMLTIRLKFYQLRGDLARQLIQRLNVTDAPHFYNLASLEGTLQCLMHITARPGWSEECPDQEGGQLRQQVLACLLEVVSAFHTGRGGSAMSYMGRGVTRAATLCLRHLAYEMATLTSDQAWPKLWLYSRHGTDSGGDPGLDWMLTLWGYRDTEVRSAGLGIAVTLSTAEEGRRLLTANCKHIPGGIWAAAFSILLDQSECSIVRQQAALVLVNLTSKPMPSGSTEAEYQTWQGPVVMDMDSQVSLVGLTALLALLHHSLFYREMVMLLSVYHPQPSIQPTLVAEVYQLSASTSENSISALADAGLVPRSGTLFGSHHNTMSLLQSTGLSSVQASERPGAIGANGQPTGSHPGQTRSNMSTPRNPGQTDNRGEEQPREATEYQSVTTPCLVSAVSQLVRNLLILAPQDTVTCLKSESLIPFFISMVDPSFLEEIQALTSCDPLELYFTELVEMHTSILRLLQTCLVHDTSTRLDILQDCVSLGGIVSLLRISSDVSADTRSVCCDLWQTTLSFLMTLVQMHSGPAVEVLAQVLQKQWEPIAGSLQKILDGAHSNKDLYTQCVNFLSVLCGEEYRHQCKLVGNETGISITKLLGQPLHGGADNGSDVTAGSSFCKALISSYDQCIGKHAESGATGERIHVITALKCLLAVSQSAKNTALDMCLVETLLDHVKQTHAKLNMSALQPGKGSNKVKDDPMVQELTLTFDLLRNFIYQNEDVKMACYHSGLHNIVHKLWSWCQSDSALMMCVIGLLTTYTASCATTCSSLAYTSATSTNIAAQTKSGLSSHSLVHCILKVVSRDTNKEPLVKGLFGLLANVALSAECRSIIWKSNFLRDFSTLNPKRSKTAKAKGRQMMMEVLWLELLLNLSFSLEGQQMILKIPDSIDLLLEFVECSSARQQECSAIILRNLCCHTSNKPKLLTHDNLLPRLLQCVESGADNLKSVAASALWALVFNNQKAKVVMKNCSVVPKLQEVLSCGGQLSEKCTTDLQAVIQTVCE